VSIVYVVVAEVNPELVQPVERKKLTPVREGDAHETAFGCARDFLETRFVYHPRNV
jgi:hypothetical protein